jgi:hypothetical protein
VPPHLDGLDGALQRLKVAEPLLQVVLLGLHQRQHAVPERQQLLLLQPLVGPGGVPDEVVPFCNGVVELGLLSPQSTLRLTPNTERTLLFNSASGGLKPSHKVALGFLHPSKVSRHPDAHVPDTSRSVLLPPGFGASPHRRRRAPAARRQR